MPKSKPKNKKKPARKSPRAFAREHVSRVVDQVKEPLSLLNTLKEEGVANAVALLGLASAMASGATKNLRIDGVKPHLRELITSMGFTMREDIEKLEARVEELELKLSAKEFEAIRGSDDE